MGCQTGDSVSEEIHSLRYEIIEAQRAMTHAQIDADEMRGLVDRQGSEVERLIDEKRHLEK